MKDCSLNKRTKTRAASQDRQLIKNTTNTTVAPPPPRSKGQLPPLPGCNVPQTLQDCVREGREQGLSKAPRLSVRSADTIWGTWNSTPSRSSSPTHCDGVTGGLVGSQSPRMNRGRVRNLLPPGSNKVAPTFPLPECHERKPAKRFK